MKRILSVTGVVLLGLALFASAGCVRVELPEGEGESSSERVEMEDATTVEASVDLAAGELTIVGGEPDVFGADFEYPSDNWRPEVEYEVLDGAGKLSVRTPDDPGFDFPFKTKTPYAWDLRMPTGLPLDLSVNVGAGQADLDLGGCDLRELGVDLGAGDTTIDLSGEWTHDLEARIEAGAGELTLKVPANVGVRIVGYRDGIGSYRADDFAQDGDALVNDAWDTATVKFEIELRRGVGEVTVETVE